MTRDAILSALRKNQRPEDANLSDEDLLYKTASAYEEMGRLDEFPALKVEKVRQDALIEADGRGFLGNVASAGMRGFAQMRQAFNVAQGAADPTNAKDIASAQLSIEANQPSGVFREFQNAPKESVGEWLTAFAKAPITIIAETMAESFGASLPSLGAMVAGGAAGAAVSAPTGPGALVGGALGAGAGSAAVETASKMLDVMREKGMDPADPESVVKFFSDPQKVSEARELGLRRGVPVGLFDGLTAGFAGRFLKPVLAARQAGANVGVRQVLGATAKELGAQSAGGVLGETMGQLAAGEEFDPRSIFLEGIAEIGSAPVEVRQNLGELRQVSRQRATSPTPELAQDQAEPELRAPVRATVPDVAPFFSATVPVEPVAPSTPVPPAQPETTAPLATEETKSVLRERGVDEVTLATITEQEAQVLLAQTGRQPNAAPSVPPEVQAAVDERARITDEAENARLIAEEQAAAQAELEAAQEEFVDPAVLRQARERAAALRGVRIGGQLGFADESFRQATQARKTAAQRRQENVAEAKKQVAAQKVEAAGPQYPLDFTGQNPIPLPKRKKAEVAPVPAPAATPATVAPVASPAPIPPQPVAFNADESLVGLKPGSTPLETIKERITGQVAALAFDPNDQSVSLLPLKRNSDGRPFVIVERGPFQKKSDLIDVMEKEYVAQFPGQKGYSRATIKSVVENLAPFTPDGQVNVEQVRRSYNSVEKQAKVIQMAQRAIDLGILKIGSDKFVPLETYLRDNGLTSGFLAITNTPIPAGPQKLSGSFEQIVERYGQKQPQKSEQPAALTEKEILKQQAADNRVPANRLLLAVENLKALQTDQLNAVRELLSDAFAEEDKVSARERNRVDAETLQYVIDRFVGPLPGDTPEFKSNLFRSALEALPKLQALQRAAAEAERQAVVAAAPAPSQPAEAKTPAVPAQQTVAKNATVAPKESPKSEPLAVRQPLSAKPKVKAPVVDQPAKVSSVSSPVSKPAEVKPVLSAEPKPAAAAPISSPQPPVVKLEDRAIVAAIEQLTKTPLLDENTYLALKSGGFRLPKGSPEMVSKLRAVINEKTKDFEAKQLKPAGSNKSKADLESEIADLTEQIAQEKARIARGEIDEDYDPADPFFDEEEYGEGYRRVQPTAEEARRQLRHPETPAGYLTPDSHELIDRIVYDLSRRGIKVSISEATKEIAAGGIYSPSKRAVALILESISNPDRQSVLNALHEITHDILAEAPETIHQAIHDVIERTPVNKLAFYQNPEADARVVTGEGLTPEQLTVERAVEHLALLNMDRDYSRGLLQAIYRAIKDAFLRAAVHLQKALVGDENTTGRLAEAWVNNQIGKVLAGDRQVFDSFLRLFGVKPTFAEVYRSMHDSRDRLSAVTIDFDGRGVSYRPIASLEGAEINVEAAFEEAKRSAQADGTWNAARDAEFMRNLFGEDVVEGTSAAGEAIPLRRLQPEFEQYYSSRAVRKAVAAARAAQAVANSLHPIVENLFAKVKQVQPTLSDAERAALRRQGTPAPGSIESVDELYRLLGLVDPRARAQKAYERLTSTIETEFETKLKKDDVLFDREVKMEDLEKGPAADLADLTFAKELGRLRNATQRRVGSLRSSVADLEVSEEKNRAVVKASMDALADAKVTRRLLNQSIAEYFKQITRDLRRVDRTGVAFGQATGILKALEKQAKAEDLSKRYTERLFSSIEFNELPLNSIFKALHDTVRRSGLDLTNSDVQAIREVIFSEVRSKSDSPLASLVSLGEGPGAADRGTALLTALINFAKNERFTSEVLRIQMMQGEEKARAINELRAIYREGNEKVLSDLADQVKNLGKPTSNFSELGAKPTLTERAAQELLNARDEALLEQTRLAKMRRDLAVLESAKTVFNQLATVADQRLQIGSAFNIADGANYIDAGTPTDSDEVLLEKAKSNKLNIAGASAMRPEEMRALIDRNEAWLNARRNDPSKQGRVYWSLKQQNREMRRFMHGEKAREFNGGILHSQMTGVADMFQQTGERAGERLASACNQAVGWSRVFNAKAEVEGKAFESARDAFEQATGVDGQTFQDLFYDPARFLLDTFQGTEVEAMQELNRKFRQDPVTNQYWSKPGAVEAFNGVIREVKKSAQLQNGWMSTTGANRVEDERISDANVFSGKQKTAMERRQIETGVPGFTTYRFIKDGLAYWAAGFRRKIAGDSPFSDLGLKLSLETSAEKLSADLRGIFDDSAWNVFLEPLLMSTDAGIPSPKGTDGVESAVTPRIVSRAMDAAGRDVIALADAIYDRASERLSDEGRTAYRKDFLSWLQNRWRFVDAMTKTEVNVDGATLSAPSLGLNARTAEFMPQEWVTYPQYTPEDHRKAAHSIVMSGVFGRNMRVLNEGILEIKEGIKAKKEELRAEGLSDNKSFDDPAWKSLKRRDPLKYSRLKKIAEYNTPPFGKVMADILNTESDMWTQRHLLQEMFGASVVGMVSGLKTAVKNLVSTSNLFLVQRSASPEVFKTVAGAYAKTGRLFLGSVTQLFGVDMFKNNPLLQRMVQAGALDAQNYITFAQNRRGERGVGDSITGFARVLRISRTLYANTTLSPIKGGTAPAIRLLNPFQYTQQLVNMSNTWQLLETYYDMALRAAEVYRANPKETRNLTAQDVGMRDQTAFEARRQLLLDNGISIEELAQRAARGKNPLDDRAIMAVNNISTTLLANEASMVNRPIGLTRTKLGQMAGTFVGWGLDQTNRTLKILETPQGRVDVDSVMRGMGVLAITMLPASLAYGALLDEWDELVEKKQNRRAVTEGVKAWPEAIASVGTFGLVGDAVDYVASMRQGSSGYNDALSLDNRIVFISSVRSLAQGLRNFGQTGLENATYASNFRPLLQAAGAGGILQNAYVLDKITGNAMQDLPVVGGVVQMESGLALRTNIYNYLRAAGREAGLEVRTQQGGSGYTLTPLSPHITNMVVAALQNERGDFQKAYREAIAAAREEGHIDPLKKVQQLFASRHPYKILFNGTPTVAEVARMRAVMGEKGSAAVSEGLRNYDSYAASLGIAPFQGSTSVSEAQMRRLISNGRGQEDLADVLSRAMNFRNDSDL